MKEDIVIIDEKDKSEDLQQANPATACNVMVTGPIDHVALINHQRHLYLTNAINQNILPVLLLGFFSLILRFSYMIFSCTFC